MKQEYIDDLKQKINVLDNTNILDPKKLPILSLLLMKGLGYNEEALKDGRVREASGHKEDFNYRCEIGKLRDKYLPEIAHFDVSHPELLEYVSFLPYAQQKSCAENVLHRLNLVIKFISKTEDNKVDLQEMLENAKSLKKKWEMI